MHCARKRTQSARNAHLPKNSAQKTLGGRFRVPPKCCRKPRYFFFEVFLAAFFALFLAAFFAAMLVILPFRCLHRSLQHKMLQLTNV
jgi:hypothetical protein